jgi:hypothetical protein
VRVGQLVDVVAAVADGQAPGGGRVEAVATGRVVTPTTTGAGSTSRVALDVDASAAERLVWAEAFAKSLRLLARPFGDDGAQ